MYRHYFILLAPACFLYSSVCHSQNVTIKGKADKNYLSEANSIYLYKYDDYISFREKELAHSPLDTGGNFSVTFPISDPAHIFLTIDNAKAEMIAEPGQTYDIYIFQKDSDAVNTLSVSVPVEIEFNNSGDKELNFLLADFGNRYEAFLEYHRPLITKKNQAIFSKIDTMKMFCNEKYSPYNLPYLNTHINYTFASLSESITLREEKKIFENYIDGKPILPGNYDYMAFFNQYFSSTVKSFMLSGKMPGEINNRQNFASLQEYFKKSSLLHNDTIREMVVLMALAEYFRYPAYKTNAVLEILDQAAKQSKTEENRKTAENLKNKLSVMITGHPVPSFAFQYPDGKSVSLTDFKGKYLYLNFWASWCSSCTQEMMLIAELKKLYAGKIVFVSISVDKKQEQMKQFLKKNPPFDPEKNKKDWFFLHTENFKKVKEEFNVLTVPTYYLIDPKGNVIKSPAEKPQNIEPTFIEIKKKK